MSSAPPGTRSPPYVELSPTACLTAGPDGWWLANPNDYYIGRSLLHYGAYSIEEIALCTRLLAPGDEVIEGGANIGSLTRWLARAVGRTGRVYAFEPQRAIYQMLCANLAIAGIHHVHHQRVALGAIRGTLRVPAVDHASVGNFGGTALVSEDTAEGEGVAVVPIDEAVSPARLKLLKLDIEGAELAALEGATQTIARFMPYIYLENDRVEQSQPLIAKLSGWGYSLYWHTPPLFSADNPRGSSENLFGPVASINMLAVPPQQTNPFPELAPITDERDHPLLRDGLLPGLRDARLPTTR